MNSTDLARTSPMLREEGVGCFGQFVFALHQKYGAHYFDGEKTWVSFPVLDVVSCGVAAFTMAIAKKHEMTVRNKEDVAVLSAYIERVLNAGFAVRFATVEEAVITFDASVIQVIAHNMREQKIAEFSAVVEDVAYSFFANVYLLAKRFWNEVILIMLRKIEQREFFSSKGLGLSSAFFDSIETRSVDAVFRSQFSIVMGIEPPKDNRGEPIVVPPVSFDNGRAVIHSYRVFLEKRLAYAKVLRRLPIDFDALQTHGYLESKNICTRSIKDDWIPTQLLLVAAGLPQGDVITDRQYCVALSVLPKIRSHELIKKFFVRISAKGWKPEKHDEAILSSLLKKELASLRKSLGSKILPLSIFRITVYDEEVGFTEHDAEMFLTQQYGNMSKKDVKRFYRRIAMQYPSKLLEHLQIAECVNEGYLSLGEIATIIIEGKTKFADRDPITHFLSACNDVAEEWKYKELFCTHGKYKMSLKELLENVLRASPKFFQRHFSPKIFDESIWTMDIDSDDLLLSVLQKISDEQLRSLVNVELFPFLFLRLLESATTELPKKNHCIKLLKRMENLDFVIQCSLRDSVGDRLHAYEEFSEHKKLFFKDRDAGYDLPWGQGPEKSALTKLFAHYPLLAHKTVEKVILENPEMAIAKTIFLGKELKKYKNFRGF